MTLLIIIVLCILLAFGLYGVALQFGLLPKLGASEEPRTGYGWPRYQRSGLGERLDNLPQGCVVSMLVVMGLWIVAWLVFLILALRLLWTAGG